jgi:hypothetical protein
MTDEPVMPDTDWLEKFLSQCGYSCGHYDSHAHVEPVVVKTIGENVPLTFLDRIGTVVAREDLLADLAPDLQECLTLGTLVNLSGRTIQDYRTVRSENPVHIRGNAKSVHWMCEVCGQFIYHPFGKWYALEQDLRKGAIHLTTLGGLIVDEQVHCRLAARRWKKVRIERFEVREDPRDRLPNDLSNYAAWEKPRRSPFLGP